jgi:hypothetical protein
MEKAAFTRWLNQALTHFERKEPSDATVDLWFQAVKDIPAKALPWLYQELISLEAFPRNLPGFMRAKIKEWLAANPQGQAKGNCECHKGVWEVAFWRQDLGEWAIFTVLCGPCNGTNGPRKRFDLLNPKLFEREPDRYMETPPSWALVYPDKDSLREKSRGIRAHLDHHLQHHLQENNLELEEALPF